MHLAGLDIRCDGTIHLSATAPLGKLQPARYNSGVIAPSTSVCRALVAFVAVGTLASILFAESNVKPKPVEQPGFEVIGIEARTNNTAEAGPTGVIPQQWQRFYMEGLRDRIPDKLDASVIAVYTDYASDANGEYAFVLGAKVKPGTKPPEGMVAKQVPAGKYMEFTSDRGPLPQVVPALWRAIYGYFQPPSAPPRAYRADYEVYDAAVDPNNGQTNVFVGVK